MRKQTPEEFLSVVGFTLEAIGYGKITLDKQSWIQLHNEGLSPLEAILASEFNYEGSAANGWAKMVSPLIRLNNKS